jgi:hypothetical protein
MLSQLLLLQTAHFRLRSGDWTAAISLPKSRSCLNRWRPEESSTSDRIHSNYLSYSDKFGTLKSFFCCRNSWT